MAMTALEQLVTRRSQAKSRLVHRLRKYDGLVQQPVEAVVGPRIRVQGRWVLNCASANYLGVNRHLHVLRAITRAASSWGTSLGMPRLFATDLLTTGLEREIANLVGQDKALVFPSTTHIALDLLPLLAGPNGVLFIDEWAYPISLEGAYAAAARGARMLRFPHNNSQILARMLRTQAHISAKVIVCDGVYSAGGCPAALGEIMRAARTFDALVYVDDAHGVGLLGAHPTREMPYGYGGSGTPDHLAIMPGRLIHVGSLSKAFGTPVAFVAGPAGFIDYLRTTAATYSHSSPPAIPVIAAALAALQVHKHDGDLLRGCLLKRVLYFQKRLTAAGIELTSNRYFPIQTIPFATTGMAENIGRVLRRKGIWAILQFGPPDHPQGGVLRFVLTTRHTKIDLDNVIEAILSTIRVVS